MASTDNVSYIYRTIIETVTQNLASVFDDDGVDRKILEELRDTWQLRLRDSRVCPEDFGPVGVHAAYPHNLSVAPGSGLPAAFQGHLEYASYRQPQLNLQVDGTDDTDAVAVPSTAAAAAPARAHTQPAPRFTQVDGASGDEKNLDDDSIGSADDDSDEDGDDDDEYKKNTVFCQYEKINKVRSKWRLNLKDGIMHIDGKDHIFKKASGQLDW